MILKKTSEIIISDQLTEISDNRFYNFSSLKKITISKNISRIGNFAFRGCYELDTVYYNGTIEDWCNIIFETDESNPMWYAKHFYIKDNNGNTTK